jgi:hypothetical protein
MGPPGERFLNFFIIFELASAFSHVCLIKVSDCALFHGLRKIIFLIPFFTLLSSDAPFESAYILSFLTEDGGAVFHHPFSIQVTALSQTLSRTILVVAIYGETHCT